MYDSGNVTVLYGNVLKDGVPPIVTQDTRIRIPGRFRGSSSLVSLKPQNLNQLLLVGESGCGKTNTLMKLTEEIRRGMTPQDVMIVFDTKMDYYNRLYREGDVVIGMNHPNPAFQWNCYKEIVADGADDSLVTENTYEMANMLFADRIKHGGNNMYFPCAARDVLAASLISFVRQGLEDREYLRENLYNRNLRSFFDRSDLPMLIDHLSQYDDLKSMSYHIRSNGINSQTQGVLSELNSLIHSVFVGEYASKGTFSMREFVKKRGGRVLFLEYDLRRGTLLAPIYRILIDLALKQALSRAEGEPGNIYFVMDELKLAPLLSYLENGLNFGRSKNCKIICGIQSSTQLEEVYSESEVQNIISSFGNVMLFRTNDSETRDLLSRRFGKNIVSESYVGIDGNLVEEKREGMTVEDWDILRLQTGEAIVGLGKENPFVFQYDLFV